MRCNAARFYMYSLTLRNDSDSSLMGNFDKGDIRYCQAIHFAEVRSRVSSLYLQLIIFS